MRQFKNFPVLFLVLSLTLALSLLGCGGNDTPTMTGQFIDSPVSGLHFETETQNGTTDAEGSFAYLDGEDIFFFLGDIFLGKAPAKPILSPLDLIGGAAEPEHPAVTNICRLLQTLDEDGNPENGIAIGDEALERAAGLSLDFDVPVAQFEENLEADETLSVLLAFGEGKRLKLVSPKAAQRHLRKSLGMEITQVTDEDSDSETPPDENVDGGNVEDEGDAETEEEETAGISDDPPAEDVNTGDKAETPEEDVEDETDTPVVVADNDVAEPETDPADDDDVPEPEADQSPGGLPVNPATDPSETPVTDPVEDEGPEETPETPEEPTETVDETPEVPEENETPVALEEICGDGVDQDGDGVDGLCPEGEETRLKVSILTPEPGDDSVSEIWLDIEKVLACVGPGGCQMVGGESRVNLLNTEEVATTLLDSFLIEETVGHLRFVLGDDSSVVVDGVSHPLSVPGGETAGLKLMWGKKLDAFELNELLLDFDPLANLSHNPGQGYVLRSVLRAQAEVNAPFAAGTAVVDPARGGTYEKPGKFKMEVPGEAVDAEAILWEMESEVEDGEISPTFTMGPDGTQFTTPIKVTLNYEPTSIPEGFTEDDLVILHDGEPVDSIVNKEANTIEGEATHFSDYTVQTCIPYLKTIDGWDVGSTEGPDYSFEWLLKQQTSCSAENYRYGNPEIFRYDGSSWVSYSTAGFSNANYPSFQLTEQAGTYSAKASFTFSPADTGTYRIYFEILSSTGSQLEHLCNDYPGECRNYTEYYIDSDTTDPGNEDTTDPGSGDTTDPVDKETSDVDNESENPEEDSTPWECDEREALYADWENHASGLGPNFTHTWGLVNNTSCPIENFTLGNPDIYRWNGTGYEAYSSSSFSGSYTNFSLAPNGGTGEVTADFNFPLPDEATYRIFFDIITTSGDVLPYINSESPGFGRLFTDVGKSIGGCFGPEPTVDYVDHVNMGTGSVNLKAEVKNAISDPTFQINNGPDQTMESGDGDSSVGGADTTRGENEYKITVEGECDVQAFLEYMAATNFSEYFGSANCLTQCEGSQKCGYDPVNTAIGNFFHQETDGVVAGLGGTTIRLARTYNAQAVQWTPASMKRFFPDGSEEVVAEPPQYFGKGWSSIFGQYMLRIEMAPVFDGIQVMYPDGHTANFEAKGDGVFESISPISRDVIAKEGDDYVLRQNGCDCSLESTRFGSDGRLKAISDRNGNEIVLHYEGDNLAGVENASGRRVDFVSDGEGRIVQAILPEGIVLTYEYSDGMLTTFTDGDDEATNYRYDDEDRMVEIITPKGHPSVQNMYDDDFRVIEQTVGEAETYTFEYEEGYTRVSDAYGNATVHHYDDEKRLVQIDHPDGTTELYEYDDDFNRTYYQDQASAEWRWTYDENGNRLTADGPLGWHREWEYNERNQVVRMSENVDAGTVRTTTFEYDANGNLVRFCNPLGDCGSVTYDGLGLPLEMTDFAGNATRHAYDGEGDLTAVTDAESATVRFDHDGLGRVIDMQKPLGAEYRYTYDPDSHLVAVDGPLGFRLEFAFDPNDNLARKVDPNGGVIQYAYNASDRLATVQNQLGFNVAAYVYGLMNELTGFTDAEGRSWSYAYDDLLRVIQVDGPLNARFAYDYNPVGKITDFTDANGIVTRTDYDPLYRPVSVIRNYRPALAPDADTNVTTTYEYDLVGDVLAATDPDGYVTQFVYDLMGRRTGKEDAEGYEWAYAYDPMGNLTEVLNPRGFTAEIEYTPTYRTARAVNPEGHAVANTYDADGRLVEQTDAKGIVTRFEYDNLGRLARKIRNYRPGMAADSETNVTTEYAYDLAGNLRYLTNPRNYEAEIVYDAAHRRTELYDFEDGQTRFAYDRVNNLLTVTDAEGNATTYQYDDLNRAVATTNAENETEAYRYDPMGNRTHLVQADGTVTQYGYDAIYRLNAVTQNHRPGMSPSNDTNVLTQYAYNARGLLTQIENANGAVTAFDYNAVGRMVQETDPLGNVWGYEYDGVGNRVRRVDAKGDPTEYAYYPDDMLEEIRYADGTGVDYAYDPNNNRVSMQDWLGGTEWDYDRLNRITAQDDPFGRGLAYAYDAASNRTGMTYPDGNQVSYAYSPNNWMDSVTIPGDLTTRYTRDRVGNILHMENPNSTETALEYDNVYRVLRLVNQQISGGAKVNSAFDYTYNEVGHITEAVKEYGWRNPPVVTETYTYDGLHRLVGTVMDPIKNNGTKEFLSYRYDPVGNRLESGSLHGQNTSSPTDGYTKTYAYNAANQLLAVETDSVKKNPNINMVTSYTYDPNGNRINKESVDANDKNALVEGFDYAFDPENRMVQALAYQLGGKQQKVRTDRHVTDLEYDGGGRRLAKSYDPKFNGAPGVDKRVEYVFSGLDPVAEYEMLNGQRDNYYRGAMGRIVTRQHFNSGATGQRYWYHYNHKHDVVGLTKHNGNSTHNYRYDPYGDVLPDNGNFTDPHNHYTLTGKEYDENMGLVWFGARHYDPEVGVWVTQDTYRGVVLNPLSIHRYAYLWNNPRNHIDYYGYDTYYINRQLGGNEARSKFNPVSHTFIAITDSSGKVEHTFSWGNTSDTMKGWYMDEENDFNAAQEAIDNKKAIHVGDGSLDPYIEAAYHNKFALEPKHRWWIFYNCKSETDRLFWEAKMSYWADNFSQCKEAQ